MDRIIDGGEYKKGDELQLPYAVVDGSFDPAKNVIGCGGVLVDESGEQHEIIGCDNDPELFPMKRDGGKIFGVILAIDKAIKLKLSKLTIYHDNPGIKYWATRNWNRNSSLTVKYSDFVNAISKIIILEFIHVENLTDIPGNDEAKKIADKAVNIGVPYKEFQKSTKKDDMPSSVSESYSSEDIYLQLTDKIKGQDAAVNSFVKELYTSSVKNVSLKNTSDKNALDKNDSKMPESVFLFAGPPGVGKTYLATEFAKISKRPYKVFPMTEYTSENDVRTLCGFGKNYQSPMAGALTGFVHKNPDAVLIFDEIEKANPMVIRLFLTVLEGANLEDLYLNEKLDFSKTICIFTTNAGRDYFEEHHGEDFSQLSPAVLLDIIKNDLTDDSDKSKKGLSAFPLEVLSRFSKGSIIAFNHMTESKLIPLIKKGLADGTKKLRAKKGLKVSYDDVLMPYIMLFSMGDKLDARVAVSKSESFLIDACYSMQSRIDQEKELYKDMEKVSFEVDERDELAKYYTVMDKKSYVWVACGDGYKDRFGLTSNKYDIDYIYRNGDNIAFGKGNYRSKGGKIFDPDKDRLPEVVFIDMAFATNSTKGEFDGLSYIKSQGTFALNWMKEHYPDIPIYAISFDKKMGLADQQLLRKEGIKDIITIENDGLQPIEDVVYNRFLSEKMRELVRSGQILNYDLVTKLSKDGKVNHIILREFEKIENKEKDAADMFISAPELSSVRFDDVIGAEDAKDEMKKFIDFVKNPKLYKDTGLKVSKGILMYGPPGTGKTMMAKALAAEAECPFISTTGADILNGAQSIKKAFSIARRYAPSIVFIDEIDAFALDRQSGKGVVKLVNELLTEMDGFSNNSSKPVFVVAATNFGSSHTIHGENIQLDAALLRRFGNRIFVDLPGKKEIETFLNRKKEDLKDKRINLEALSDEDISFVAEMIIGSSLAEVENILNYVGGIALKNNVIITKDLFIEGYEETKYGKKTEMKNGELKKTAIHEAGHAVIGWIEEGDNKPKYATITSRGGYLGYVRPDISDKYYDKSKEDLLKEIRTELAGRAAELAFYEKEGLTVGASDDLGKASYRALSIVARYGMEDGMLLSIPIELKDIPLSPVGEKYMDVANNILAEQMKLTQKMVANNKDVIEKFADELINNGHLNKDAINRFFEYNKVKK